MADCLISVAIITFNQAQYLREAIDSVLAQTNCGVIEIIVGDDASTDDTAKILREYKRTYPGIFTIISRDINVGPSKNLYDVFSRCTGRYIAVLEGDDFWSDSTKLEKQTKFLDSNESYVACTHRYKVVDAFSDSIHEEYQGPGRPAAGLYRLKDFEEYVYYGHLGTLVFRNLFVNDDIDYSIIKDAHHFIADITLNLFLCFQGDIEVLDLNMAAHRVIVEEGGTNYASTISKKNQIRLRILYLEVLKRYAFDSHRYNLCLKNKNESYFWWSVLWIVKHPSAHNLRALLFTYSHARRNKARLISYFFSNSHKMLRFLKKYLD